MRRNRLVSRAAMVVAAVGLAGGAAPYPRAADAEEPGAPYALYLNALAAEHPDVRVDAIQRIDGLHEAGLRLALVLADVAVEDPEQAVRDAAADVVERVAEVALVSWMRYLGAVDAGRQPGFGKAAETLVKLERKARAADFAAALAAATKDAEVAAVLGALPLLLAWNGAADRDASPGLDVLLESRAVGVGPLSADLAPVCLALLAAARVRDRGPGAPGTTERPNLAAADVRALLAPKPAGAKRPAGLTEAVLAVMGAVARPDAETLALLATLAETSPHAVAALTRLGAYASPVGLDLRAKLPELMPARGLLLARLGRSEEALPARPHELKLAFEQKEGPRREVVDAFAAETRSLATRHPEMARRAVPALLYIARGDFKTPVESRIAAIEALGRAGRLSQHALDLLREIAAKRRPPAKRGAKDAPAEESNEQRVAGHAYVALLRGAPDPSPEIAALGDVLGDPREADWSAELKRALPGVAARLAPAREVLVTQASLEGRDDAAGLSTSLALFRVLSRVPEHDSSEAASYRRFLDPGPGAKATRELQAKDFTKAFAAPGSLLPVGLEARRAAVDALAACGPHAKEAIPVLEALRRDPDVSLRFRVERALTALRAE